MIKFDDLKVDSKREIAKMQFEQKYESYTNPEQKIITSLVSRDKLIESCTYCNNAREISHLIDDTFALVLLRSLIS